MEGKFKVFITYSFLLTSLILTVTNISFSCVSISGEWKRKTLFLLDVKTIRRWEIILGKWFGLLFLNLFLIITFLISMGFSSILLSNRLEKDFPEGKKIFLTYTQVFPVSSREKSQIESSSLLSSPEVSSSLTPSTKRKETYAVPPRGKIEWSFRGIKNASSDIYLVFRFYTSEKEKKEILGYWLVGNPSLKKPLEISTVFSPDKVHRLRIPTEAVSKKGELSLTYLNIDPKNVSVLFPRRELRVIYPWGSYWGNLLRSGTNLLLVAGFISAVGIFFSTLVSTLTAILSTSVLVFISYLHDFVEIITKSLVSGGTDKAVDLVPRFSYPLLKLLTFLLPPLNKFLPHSYIGDFLILTFSYLREVFLRTLLLGAIPVLLVAIIYFSRRELGIPNE